MSSSTDDILIELVKSIPWLWDCTRSDYKDRPKKENSWISISNQLHISVTDCQRRWKTLRDRFATERRKLKATKQLGVAAVKYPKWIFFDQLSFLSSHVKQRRSYPQLAPMPPGVTTLDASQSDSCEVPLEHAEVVYGLDETYANFSPLITCATSITTPSAISIKAEVEEMSPVNVACPTPPPLVNHVTIAAAAASARKCTSQNDTNALVNSIVSATEVFKSQVQNMHDEEMLFCRSVTETLKRMTPRNRAMCKAKIQQILVDYEFNLNI